MTATIPVYPGDLAYVEDVVNRYCNGRIPESSVSYHLRRVNSFQMPPELEAAFEAACAAYRRLAQAEVGDITDSPQECRAALDDGLAALVRACKAAYRRPRLESAA